MTEVVEIGAIVEIEKEGDQGLGREVQIEGTEMIDHIKIVIRIADQIRLKNQENVSLVAEEKMNYLLKKLTN